MKRTAVNNLNSIKQYSGKTLNDAKNVRSFGDASNLGRVSCVGIFYMKPKKFSSQIIFFRDFFFIQNIFSWKNSLKFYLFDSIQTLVNDGIQTTGYYVKSALFRKTIDEEMRKRIIMRDCISLVISQLNAFDLTNFIQVSKNLTSLGEEKIAKMQIVPNDQVPDAETHYFADLNIAAAQNAVNSEETRQYTPKSFNVNQSNKYFETLMYLGNTIPSCYHYNYNINLLQNKKWWTFQDQILRGIFF